MCYPLISNVLHTPINDPPLSIVLVVPTSSKTLPVSGQILPPRPDYLLAKIMRAHISSVTSPLIH